MSIDDVNLFGGPDVFIEDGSNIPNWRHIGETLKTFAMEKNVDIYVSNDSERTIVPPVSEPGKLFIRFYAVPQETEARTKRQIFGHELWDPASKAWAPANLGKVFKYSGQPYAEAVGGTLYILVNILDSYWDSNRILSEILARVGKGLEVVPLTEDVMAERCRLATELARDKYVVLCQKNRQLTEDDAKKTILEARKSALEGQKKLVEASRKQANTQLKVDQIELTCESLKCRLEEEFEAIKRLPGIERFAVTASRVTLITKPVKVTLKGTNYELGRYRVDILDKGTVECRNLDKQVNGLHHPHIGVTGICEFGAVSAAVAKQIAMYQYSAVAKVSMKFLKTYKPAEALITLEEWVEADARNEEAQSDAEHESA